MNPAFSKAFRAATAIHLNLAEPKCIPPIMKKAKLTRLYELGEVLKQRKTIMTHHTNEKPSRYNPQHQLDLRVKRVCFRLPSLHHHLNHSPTEHHVPYIL